MHLEQLAPGMGPTRGVPDARELAWRGPIQRVVAQERIGMHHAGEPGQVLARALALAIGRVAVERRRRTRSRMGCQSDMSKT